jgi:hypothetical protein
MAKRKTGHRPELDFSPEAPEIKERRHFFNACDRGLRVCDILELMADRRFTDVGGTSGGLGDFLLGFALTCVGGYLLTNQVIVAGSYWNFWGGNTFGITLIPMLIGVGLLFRDGRSVIGWLLTAAGALFIVAGVLANMHIYFQPTSLFNTIVMLVLLVGGLGLIARAMRPHSTG